jgi:hypothetical protein
MGFLGEDHAADKGGGVEVGARGDLSREHVLTRRGLAVGIMHVRHLQYLELPTFPKPQLSFRREAPDRKPINTKDCHSHQLPTPFHFLLLMEFSSSLFKVQTNPENAQLRSLISLPDFLPSSLFSFTKNDLLSIIYALGPRIYIPTGHGRRYILKYFEL